MLLSLLSTVGEPFNFVFTAYEPILDNTSTYTIGVLPDLLSGRWISALPHLLICLRKSKAFFSSLLGKPLVVLLYVVVFFLLELVFFQLLRYHFSCWRACHLFKLHRLEPAFWLHHLALNLLETNSIVVKSHCKARTDLSIVILSVNTRLRAVVVAIETVFQSEWVHDLELLPNYNSGRSNFARFDSKLTRG